MVYKYWVGGALDIIDDKSLENSEDGIKESRHVAADSRQIFH